MEKYLQDVKELNKPEDSEQLVFGTYIGIVLANNHPMQMPYVRLLIHGIDDSGLEIERYRWVPILTDLAGTQLNAAMGPNNDVTPGMTSYGTFKVPKVGAIAVVQFIGGYISNPIIIGFLPSSDMITGLPMGNRGKNEIYTSSASDIKKLKENLDLAFGSGDSDVKDTRGYEVTARAPGERTGIPDVTDGNRKTGDIDADRKKMGYPKSVNSSVQEGPDNEPTMYSFTTPSQNSILLNDDPDNFRIRIKTLCGNQIILDDTNERIYISTGEGKSYIEMDMDGHIDIYSAFRVSVHSESDINLKSDQQVNIEGTNGINLKAGKDIKISTDTSINVKAGANIYNEATKDVNVKAGANNQFESGKDTSIKSDGNVAIDGSKDVGLKAGTNLIGKGTKVDLNGKSPPSSKSAKGAIAANKSNRNPAHEATDWRSIDKTGKRSDAVNSAHENQKEVTTYENKKEGGKTSKKRLKNWRK